MRPRPKSWPPTTPDAAAFDSAIGGLGGCPFAQDVLVGNIPTETVLEALQRRDVPFADQEAHSGSGAR